jgi:hypothetical protein
MRAGHEASLSADAAEDVLVFDASARKKIFAIRARPIFELPEESFWNPLRNAGAT